MDTKTTAGAAQGGAENETPTTDEAGVDTTPRTSTTKTTEDATPTAGPAGTGVATDVAPESEEGAADETDDADDQDLDVAADAAAVKTSSGVGLGAAAVVSAVLGFVALSGSWIGTVASDRQSVVGQLKAQASQAQSASDATAQLRGIYGDAWHLTAMIGGGFALAALLVGVFVLVRPAFGTPDRTSSAPWVKSVAWGGVVLGVIGLLLAVLKVTDLVLGLPSVSS